ncbi:class I SAM-dependent methyltransferase [Umezawaea sp. Da 62-37]|uniref:class I SAM-dependent methyltransferase n=1 Tax=Umezawaea sp. Da 62-37 TaxID=3075927 RepID=UPI0028F7358F|nr:class I SAM-dependent methyltransferase [Umezawaea sp. Da 62-37]WNV88937.1 class I SAM-dependent methyltransferase [Umezawaea sp. Da 62-37]
MVSTGVEDGVGLTALMVAAARAIETHRHDTLARDVYAEHFVRAAAVSADWPLHPADVHDGDANPLWGRMARYFGLRTRVLDDHLVRAAQAGTRQVVLLGAGLDSRAYRLDWPPGVTVYELDQPEVLTFKHNVLTDLEATPLTTRVPIPVDLRDDWTTPLLAAGFTPALPTAWLAEGLLLYLSGADETRLITTVDHLSPPGSTLAYEVKPRDEHPRARLNPLYAYTLQHIGLDLPTLFNKDDRPDSATTLTTIGWSTTSHTPFDFTRLHGRGPHPEPDDAFGRNRWVFATKGR